jgi:hypothetical protein
MFLPAFGTRLTLLSVPGSKFKEFPKGLSEIMLTERVCSITISDSDAA